MQEELVFNIKSVKLYRSPIDSHKGQNGKLLVIGGSELFHSSIFWSADVASKIVDLVHLTSPANENNQIFRQQLKQKFWNGIVVDWKDVEEYIEEDDCILIGPGMVRSEVDQGTRDKGQGLREAAEKDDTREIVNILLKKYQAKKWVIDGGALQEVDFGLITESCILTPHKKEFDGLIEKVLKRPGLFKKARPYQSMPEACVNLSQNLKNCTILLKGQTDIVCQGKKCVSITGGNAGMTKGGTGDVLAGLAAALYAKNDSWTAATAGSYVNKRAGDELYKKVGPYFNAADLVNEIPQTMKYLREYNSPEQKALHKL